jgi:phage shock protein PspC (stress-responsive transcriptional regulator)
VKLGWFGALMILLVGAVIGTLLGQVVGMLLPGGAAHELFFKGVSIGLKEPLHLDLSVLQVIFGITLSVNPLTLVGLLLAIYLVVKFWK